ncbi:hypothetical protein DFJ74DRAFT_721470 [Hyaloraphidium curvatum]|nr:hypothetical protein DFJ74DRAFT_721470 [Hyaloraphidium curvatum]
MEEVDLPRKTGLAGPDAFSVLPETVASAPDKQVRRRILHRTPEAEGVLDPRHRSLADPETRRKLSLPLPGPEYRPLLDRDIAPMSEGAAAEAFERGGLLPLAVLTRARLALAVAEKYAGTFVLGNVAMLLSCIALLAAIGLSRDPGEPIAPFALACTGILLCHFATLGSMVVQQHRAIVAPGFRSPADPELVGDMSSRMAYYLIRTGGGHPGTDSFLRHAPPGSDVAALEGLYAPARGGERAGKTDPESGQGAGTADPGFRRSDTCPCPQCLGFFAHGGWPVVLRFVLLTFVLLWGYLAAITALCFWNLWAPGTPPLQGWVAACLAIYVAGVVTSSATATARGSGAFRWVNARIIGAVQLRAARATCGEFIGACADLVRAAVAPSLDAGAPTPLPARSQATYPLPEFYARVASDIRVSVQSSVIASTYTHVPLAGSAACVLGALLCSLPTGGSCFPAWGLAFPLFGLHVASVMLAVMALVNASADATSQAYRESAGALTSLLAELHARPHDPL